MKLAKFAFVCAAVVSLTAVADDASSVVGILKASNPNNLKMYPVGFNFAAADGEMSVSNAVKTASLPAGTLLYVYDPTEQKYSSYRIDGNAWTSASSYYFDGTSVTEQEVSAPNAMTVKAGSAAFLVFPANTDPSNYSIVTAGKPVTAAASGVIGAGANLCCFPAGKAVNLNTDTTEVAKLFTAPTATTFANQAKTVITTQGDTIVVPQSDAGASRVYYFDGTSWGYIGRAANSTKKSFITDATVPGGLGFWYNKASAQQGN